MKKIHMKEPIDWYTEGSLTPTGFVIEVAKRAASDEIDEFVEKCPPELLDMLKDYLKEYYGDDESKWGQTYCIGAICSRGSAEQWEESRQKEQQAIWDGVRLLKRYFHD